MASCLESKSYVAGLLKRGYYQIGGGLFSQVFAKKNSDYVIKVSYVIDKWPDYIEWAINHGYDGKFAPKVYSLKFYDGFYVAIMERLVCTIEEIERNGGRRTYQQWLCRAIRDWTGYTYGSSDDNPAANATELEDFCRKLCHLGMNGDLHNGNVMIRKDGQIVIIDPCGKSSDTCRLRIKHSKVVTLGRSEEHVGI
jgi:hypothetical protein